MGHLSAQLMLRYRSRSLAPAELLDLDRHVTDCERCRAALALAVNVAAPDEANGFGLLKATAELSHPALEHWRDYLAQRLDAIDRELCESHFRIDPLTLFSYKVKTFLQDPQRRQLMEDNARRYAKPKAATDIIASILNDPPRIAERKR